jgi:GH15 family glucan-1,4-alpha-glucosidase
MPTLDLAPVGNCAIASLVDASGRHEWHCFPRLDGDPIFNALINGDDPERGFMDIVVRDQRDCSQSYVRNTAILETFISDKTGGKVRVLDFAPRFQRLGRIYRPPMLVRRVEPVAGRPRLRVRLRPSFDYGKVRPAVTVGSNHVRFVGPSSALRATTDMPIAYLLDEAELVLHRPLSLFVGPDEPIPENPDAFALSLLAETESHWQDWVRELAIPFEWQEAVIRAAITLKLCSFEDTGAIVAALTTSIPEAPGSARNWDYRFWGLRDAFFTVNALNWLGATRMMEGFVRFVIDVALRDDSDVIAPLYPIAPATVLEEREAPELNGYRGMGPVRIGNAAASQRQNDAYGSIILTAAQMFWDCRLPTRGDDALYRLLGRIGTVAGRGALEADAGPWEYRGRARVHTYSAAMCWAALHRLALIARQLGLADEAATWLGQANALRRDLDRLAGSINGRHAEFDWAPLRYMTRAVARTTLAGFYRVAKVGLVTPLRDGMNLVAKEFVAAQDPQDPGVLILSRFAGAAERMRGALIVNPFDTDEIADALNAALAMNLQMRRIRFERLIAEVNAVTAATYCRTFLDALAERGASRKVRQ